MSKWIKNNIPGTYNFFVDFFEAMNNKSTGHSLRKWLSVGFFWIIAEISFKFTNPDNLISVLTILAGMVTALTVTYTVGNTVQHKINKKSKEPEITDEQN